MMRPLDDALFIMNTLHSFFVTLVAAVLAPLAALAQETAQPDFGDYTSQVLTTKAWEALAQKNYDQVYAMTGKCIELYAAKATEMQTSLTAPAPADTAATYWALNDVGTCLYIRAQAYEAQGKSKEALADYKKLMNDYSYAQTWDPKGWFWRPADAAKQRVKVIEFDAF